MSGTRFYRHGGADARRKRRGAPYGDEKSAENPTFSAKHKPQLRYKGIAVFVFMWYNNIVIISYDEGRILYGKTIFVDNEHRRKHTVLS